MLHPKWNYSIVPRKDTEPDGDWKFDRLFSGKSLKGLVLRIVPNCLLNATYRRVKHGKSSIEELYWIKRQEVVEFLERNGARIIDIKQDIGSIAVNCRYCVTKEWAHRLTAEKREIKDFPKFPLATSFICKTLSEIRHCRNKYKWCN